MTGTGERQNLVQFGEEQGWRCHGHERADVYLRGTVRIRVIWQGDEQISGASLFHDEMYESYTRDLAIVRAWFKR
ncbi:MAG: hypothetical protein EBU23_09525 [Mycobacteriaceae bacterium]|nr:hypothetical protein [Mycobacterium sp.]NBP85605.1 hypothetical protein [Mycobacteriaceae bacterium]NBQ42744.1 hypothetical protein [Mycobacteriaceae bacterium]